MSAHHESLAAAIESNVAGFLLSMGRAGGGAERDDDLVTWTVGGSPIEYHNAVVRCSAATDAAALRVIEAFRTELVTRGVAVSWHWAPSMRPHPLPDLLAQSGLSDSGDEPAMAADLRTDPPVLETAAASFDIARVNDVHGLDGYRAVLADGFGEGAAEADWVASVFGRIGLQGDVWHHYLGAVDGVPVSTASLFLTPGSPWIAGIYFVATRPAHRRRGLGAAITRHVMVEARRLGASTVVLGSSPMGYGIYRALGFREVFRYRLFEWGQE